MWLRDFVPVNLPKARVMTYGYDSNARHSDSVSGISDFAKALLVQLVDHRQSRVIPINHILGFRRMVLRPMGGRWVIFGGNCNTDILLNIGRTATSLGIHLPWTRRNSR